MKKNKITSVFLIVFVSLFLGLIGGGIINIFLNFKGGNNSLLDANKTLDLNSPEYNNTSLVIQDPKKVYISQDLKIGESLNYLNEAVVGIFPKIKEDKDVYKNNYVIGEEDFTGVVISSDGWVIINILEKNKLDKDILKNKDSYVVIFKKGKKIYEIEEIVDFSAEGLLFLKIKDINNLAVRNFVNLADLSLGQTVLAYNFFGEINLNSINLINSGADLKFSDNYEKTIDLNNDLAETFKNAYLFNLSGDLLALIDADLKLKPIHNFKPNIYELLKNKKFSNIDFGLYYLDLKNIFNSQLPAYGALVYNQGLSPFVKGSLAESSGLQVGDIITKINNYDINNEISFNDALNNFVLGDKISLNIIRDGVVMELKMELK